VIAFPRRSGRLRPHRRARARHGTQLAELDLRIVCPLGPDRTPVCLAAARGQSSAVQVAQPGQVPLRYGPSLLGLLPGSETHVVRIVLSAQFLDPQRTESLSIEGVVLSVPDHRCAQSSKFGMPSPSESANNSVQSETQHHSMVIDVLPGRRVSRKDREDGHGASARRPGQREGRGTPLQFRDQDLEEMGVCDVGVLVCPRRIRPLG
jgi:hypothetical protein